MYTKVTLRPWHKKSSNQHDAYKPAQPVEYVSVDQLNSPTPGLIARLTGKLTTKHYNTATVFVNQAIIFIYAHFHNTYSSNETLKAKQVFELMAHKHGVKI